MSPSTPVWRCAAVTHAGQLFDHDERKLSRQCHEVNRSEADAKATGNCSARDDGNIVRLAHLLVEQILAPEIQ